MFKWSVCRPMCVFCSSFAVDGLDVEVSREGKGSGFFLVACSRMAFLLSLPFCPT